MENTFVDITYNKQKQTIIRYNAESEETFNNKLAFIKKLETKNVAWKEAERLTNIWYGIFVCGCKYEQNVYLNVMKYTN